MDIYRSRSNWQVILGAVGILILLVTIFYSNYLANKLEENERKSGELFVQALKELSENENLNTSAELPLKIMQSFALPVIFINESGELGGENWGEVIGNDTSSDLTSFYEQKVEAYLADGKAPYEGPGGYATQVYVFNSPVLAYIRYFPIVQVFLVSLFVIFSYFLFNTSRRAEQNRVWAGMAKETAHQLGTPISAILGWIEYLKGMDESTPDQQEVLGELVKDVDRLVLVADRFSKIGSAPDLKRIDIYEEITKCCSYMQRRSPRKVAYQLPEALDPPVYVMINQHLFDWVIENLIRNALDAMDGIGTISAEIYKEETVAVIDIIDTGKGIPSSAFKSVFKPGYSTKKRGWGLGLSLAKRIIESYHNGKINVKSSKPGEGTTFTIKLPLADA